MALATRRLTEGDYSVRLAERGHDELSRLAQDFNVLAETLEAGGRRAIGRTAQECAGGIEEAAARAAVPYSVVLRLVT